MTSQKQIEANRKNALRSTGPRTPDGKTIVSQNPARHGLYTSSPVIPGVESAPETRLSALHARAASGPPGPIPDEAPCEAATEPPALILVPNTVTGS
jgi:hypothetical protein